MVWKEVDLNEINVIFIETFFFSVLNVCLVFGITHESIAKGRPQPRLLNILHAIITITIRDYEIQLIIITITWYGFLKRHCHIVTNGAEGSKVGKVITKCSRCFRKLVLFYCQHTRLLQRLWAVQLLSE